MAHTIETPKRSETCQYCGSEIFEHEPICVRDCEAACGDPVYFCNFACLRTFVDEQDLAVDDACRWSPD